MKIDNQLRILRRISAFRGNPGEYKLHHAGPKVNYIGAGGWGQTVLVIFLSSAFLFIVSKVIHLTQL